MKPKFLAFHGKQEVKDKYIARMKAHIEADELVQGTGYNEGKGCAVGCTLNEYSHFAYEKELGIPFTVAILEDEIFESLSKANAKSFPLEFLESTQIGADLSNVYNKIEIFDLKYLSEKLEDEDKKICIDLISLHEKVINGIETLEEDWKNLADRAYLAHRDNLTYLANRSYLANRANLSYLANRANLSDLDYRADRADRSYLTNLTYLSDRSYLANLTYLANRANLTKLADERRNEFIKLIKNSI